MSCFIRRAEPMWLSTTTSVGFCFSARALRARRSAGTSFAFRDVLRRPAVGAEARRDVLGEREVRPSPRS
jgi:hypothetical protein